MGTSSTIEPIKWTPVQPNGPVDTVNEAVGEWLNKQGANFDLTKLSLSDLKRLITYLESLKGQPWAKNSGLNQLIANLKSIQVTWQYDTGTSLDNLQRDLGCRVQVLQALAQVTKNPQGQDLLDNLDVALASVQSTKTSVDSVVASIDQGTRRWSGNDSQSLTDIRNLLTTLTTSQAALKAQGIDTAALGLDQLIAAITNALEVYGNAILNADPKGIQIALSKLRQSVANAKVEYLRENGADANDPRLLAEKSVSEVEKMWQDNLAIPWTDPMPYSENGLPISVQSIDNEINRLQEQYNLLVGMHNVIGMKFVQDKIKLLEDAKISLQSGKDPLMVQAELFMNVKLLEIATKKVLRADALKAAQTDPTKQALADRYDTDIQTLQNIVKTTLEKFGELLDKWADINSSALANALR